MQASILLLAFAAIVEAHFSPEHLHTREILPRGSPRSKTQYPQPRTQPNSPEWRSPASSRANSPSTSRPSNQALVKGVLNGPGLIITNTHSSQDATHAQIHTNIPQIRAQGSSVASVSTTSDVGSMVGASGNRLATATVKNGSNTQGRVTYVDRDGPLHAHIPKGGEAIFNFPGSGPGGEQTNVVAQQFGPGILTATAVSDGATQQQNQGMGMGRGGQRRRGRNV